MSKSAFCLKYTFYQSADKYIQKISSYININKELYKMRVKKCIYRLNSRYVVQISHKGRTRYIGRYYTLAEAEAIRDVHLAQLRGKAQQTAAEKEVLKAGYISTQTDKAMRKAKRYIVIAPNKAGTVYRVIVKGVSLGAYADYTEAQQIRDDYMNNGIIPDEIKLKAEAKEQRKIQQWTNDIGLTQSQPRKVIGGRRSIRLVIAKTYIGEYDTIKLARIAKIIYKLTGYTLKRYPDAGLNDIRMILCAGKEREGRHAGLLLQETVFISDLLKRVIKGRTVLQYLELWD